MRFKATYKRPALKSAPGAKLYEIEEWTFDFREEGWPEMTEFEEWKTAADRAIYNTDTHLEEILLHIECVEEDTPTGSVVKEAAE